LRGTIEEKIAELKARKRAIADAVIREDAGEMRGLDAEDVRLLLSGVDTGADAGVDIEVEEEAPPVDMGPSPPLVGVRRGRRPKAGVAEAPRPREVASAGPEPKVPVAAPPAEEPAGVEPNPLAGLVEGAALSKLVEDVRSYLRETGDTQRDYSARVGVSESKLSRLLNGYVSEIDRPLAARMLRAMIT
jgi:hypothetical protein